MESYQQLLPSPVPPTQNENTPFNDTQDYLVQGWLHQPECLIEASHSSILNPTTDVNAPAVRDRTHGTRVPVWLPKPGECPSSTGKFKCVLCPQNRHRPGYVYPHKFTYRRHIQDLHLAPKVYRCAGCHLHGVSMLFDTEKAVSNHIKEDCGWADHGHDKITQPLELPLICTHCELSFSSSSLFVTHIVELSTSLDGESGARASQPATPSNQSSIEATDWNMVRMTMPNSLQDDYARPGFEGSSNPFCIPSSEFYLGDEVDNPLNEGRKSQ